MVYDPVCSRIVDAYQVKTTTNEFELFGAEMKLVIDKMKKNRARAKSYNTGQF